MELEDAILFFVGGVIVIPLLAIMFGLNWDFWTNLFIPLGAGIVVSSFIEKIINGLTGGYLRDKFIKFEVHGFPINLSLIWIAVMILARLL